MAVNGGGRPFAEARALLLLMLAALATSMMAMVLASPQAARAATLTVTNTNDSGDGSLRQAMLDARATGSADTIGFDPSLSGKSITLDSQLPVVTAAGGALTIDGGSADISVSGNDTGQVRLFEVGDAAKLTLKGLTVTDSHSGAILNKGTLEVSYCTISGNSAESDGGGIYNDGALEISNSIISSNSADNGGGVYSDTGSLLTMSNSTISENEAASAGGGVYDGSDSTVTQISSTISGNSAETGGGGIYSEGTLEVSNSTISGNSNNVTGGGGGIFNHTGVARMWNTTIAGNRAPQTNAAGGILNDRGPATMWNTIVANNTVGGGPGSSFPNCFGETVTNGGNNLDSGTSCGFGTANGSLSNTNPMLGTLKDNGGPTETHALLFGSPALNAGNNAFAVDPDGNPLQFDQRGEGFPRVVGPAVDMGAFEFQGKGVGSEPPPTEVPEDKQACKKGGYEEFGFKNQGQCIKAVNHAS
jgi:predicted outer membrane repeat protein